MTDLIPSVQGSYFPPRNRAERKPSFSRHMAASFSTDDDYVYGYESAFATHTLVPLSLSEMLAGHVEVIHAEAEAYPAIADPLAADHVLASLGQAVHTTDRIIPHEVDSEV